MLDNVAGVERRRGSRSQLPYLEVLPASFGRLEEPAAAVAQMPRDASHPVSCSLGLSPSEKWNGPSYWATLVQSSTVTNP